jgi:hypothetical protein
VISRATRAREPANTSVMTSRRVRLILDLEDDAASPRGELSAEGQPPRAFSGWLQFGEAIEAALASARDSRPADGLAPPGAAIPDTSP